MGGGANMRLFTFSIWVDAHWPGAMGKSWRKRRYWLSIVATKPKEGRLLAIQMMDVTVKLWIRR